MNKQIKHTYGGMTKDISKSRFPNTSYFDAKNFRITATDNQSTYALTNEKGTVVQITFPDYIVNSNNILISNQTIPYTVKDIPLGTHRDHKLVGSINVKDGIVFFTTGTIDSIWLHKFDNENHIDLLYARDLKFTQDNQITGVSNYENEKIEKIYWVDSLNQLRHLNIRHSKDNGDYENIIDIPTDNINMVGKIKINQPIIKEITTGGNHTAGVIQYAYNLYRLNGGQSQTSPLSEQVALGNGAMGGAGVNQPANTAPIIRIEDIDPNYTNIKVYALKYTSYGVLPEVNIIYDQTIPESRNVEIFDDGLNIGSITIEEFLFLSTDIVIPKHITAKDNYMFYSNFKEKNFKVNLDVRAYSFDGVNPATAVSRVYSDVESLDNLTNTPVRLITPGNFPDNPNDTFDNINLDYDTYKYSMNSYVWDNTFLIPATGGTGKYLTYEIIPTKTYNSRNKYFKDQEIYRIGVQFYNTYGKTTNPMWIADFKTPTGNMMGMYNTLNFKWKPAFYTWLNSQTFDDYDRPVGYKILIAERGADDRTIITSGLISTMMVNVKGDGSGYNTDAKRENKSEDLPKLPNFLMRNINFDNINSNTRPLYATNHLAMMSRARGVDSEVINGKSGGKSWQYNKMLQLFSPDTIFNQNISLPSGIKMRIKGLMRNTYNAVWAQEVNASSGILITDGKGEDGVSIPFTKNTQMTEGVETSLHDTGIISHPGGSDPNVFSRDLFYRRYGLAAPEIENANGVDDEGYNILLGGSGYYHLLENTPKNNTNTASATLNVKSDELLFTLRKSSFNPIETVHSRTGVRLTITVEDSLPFDYKITYSINDVIEEIKGTATNSAIINLPLLETMLSGADPIKEISIIPSIKRNTPGTINGMLRISNNVSVGNPNIVEFCNDSSFVGNSMNTFMIMGSFILFNINNTSNPTNPINPLDSQSYYQHQDKIYDIYGRPEFALRGQNYKSYNKDNKFRYSNTLQSFSSDNDTKKWKEGGIYGRRIVSIDSDANNNITFVPTINDTPATIEDLYANLPADSTTLKDAVPYVELIKSRNDIYLGGLYGGNSYEDKLRTKYIEIGNYNDITINSIHILSPGDTFVQNFKFLRIVRRDDNVVNQGTYHMEEIVEFPVETIIDLENRNDVSHQDWDGKIAYSNIEYHDYNRVYSQPNNLHQKTGNEYTVKEVDSYETNVVASKLKTSGELIDNWLDILPNEVINLDGKFGPVTNLLFLNDEVYTLQDRAFSKLSINPRVQVQGNDGISIELGSGTVLQDYQYISTNVGCKNKHGSIVTPYGIYFYDSNNKRINQFSGQLTPISETAGLHSFLYNKDLKDIDIDKPLKNKGLSLGYDYVNNDIYFTFLTNSETFTLRYTEKGNMFVNNNDYGANHYCGLSNYFFGNLSDNKINRFYKGKYNEYFGEHKPSKVTLLINPEADLSIVVNNIAFKSEAYLDGVDQPNTTLTHIRAYNEYQDSGLVPLTTNRRGNIKRLFREWNAQVPRDEGKRDRIRNPWTYLELTFDNPGNIEFILHDMIVSYTV